ncbi:MAG: hypothetical protein AB8G86_06195 [Saprospiraceae bacterium]
MGFADRLKSLFIVEGEGNAKKASPKSAPKKATQKKTSPKSTSTPTKEVAPTVSSEPQPGKPTTKFMEIFFGAMEKHNLDGFDYLEFKESLKSLEKMPMDEQTRFQSAFAMAKTMGATPQKLIDAAAHYLKVLLHEEKKFEQALENQRKRQIGGREKQIKDLEVGIQQKAQHIKKLTQEIEQSQKQLAGIKSEISGAVSKVETTKNNFIASYNVVVAQIQSDVENMKKYLK